MLLFFLIEVLCADKIKFQIVGEDKFLGISGDKLTKVGYREAMSLTLQTMKNISEKAIETREKRALTETGFWFFPKKYVFKKNKMESKQAFRIVYYAPNEYLIMKDDKCLGFKEGSKFKRVDCTADKATRFKICTNEICDSYVDLLKELTCIKGILGMNGKYNRNNPNGFGNNFSNGFYGNNDDSDSDFGLSRRPGRGSSQNPYNGKSRRNKMFPYGGDGYSSDSSSSSNSNDAFSGCKEFNYKIPGYNRNAHGNKYQPLYDTHDRMNGRNGFPYNC